MGFVPYKKGPERACFLFHCSPPGEGEKTAVCKPGGGLASDTGFACIVILDFSTSGMERNKHCLRNVVVIARAKTAVSP